MFEVEKKYIIIECGFLVVIYVCKKFRNQLGYKVVFYIDYDVFKYFVNKVNLLGRIFKWIIFLQGFDNEVYFEQEKNNVNVDFLF